MVSLTPFQTRARTIDHLGREQIADCPTAISELWKNSYDAYARNVELHIFDGEPSICALVDNGHGMNKNEFEEKWLTVGTESKISNTQTSEVDRDGLPVRPKQGQKGIGRLSCAALGNLLLLVSKRKNQPFVAALIDWRIFQNPYLLLNDIQIPLVEFQHKEELLFELPNLFDSLLSNVSGNGTDVIRDARVKMAWQQFSEQEEINSITCTQKDIENTLVKECFTIKHFYTWDVWSGHSENGTALFLADIHDDLKAQALSDSVGNLGGPETRARTNFLQTLSNFTDPFAKQGEPIIKDFSYAVIAWNGQMQRPIIDSVGEFDLSNFEELEHIIEGHVDDTGCFTGKVKTFGVWYEDITIKPKSNYRMRQDSKFGPFHLRVGSFEGTKKNTSLSDVLHAEFVDKSARYGGFMIFRDGLRVMPYGREDNDYFEIEKRRSMNAGRYFWSNRRTFGRVSITRVHNPNLKDKAGREGLIENKASKLFREIVENILISVADRFLGSNSEYRKESLHDLHVSKEKEKLEADKKKLLKRQRARIKKAIRENIEELKSTVSELNQVAEDSSHNLCLDSQESATDLKEKIGEYAMRIQSYSLSPIPAHLGSIETAYREYRSLELKAKELVKHLDTSVNTVLEKMVHVSDYEFALKIYKSKLGQLQANIRKYAKEGRSILGEEIERFNLLVEERNRSFQIALKDHLEDLNLGRTELNHVLAKLDDEFIKQDLENTQNFKPYLSTLISLKEHIDLEGLAIQSMNEISKWKTEVDRLHQLAQLGITVEIIGHEIEGLDMTISRSLKVIKDLNFNPIEQQAYHNIVQAHQSLSDKLRFLSPLKLSGEKTKSLISGADIVKYLTNYFAESFKRNNIDFLVSESFTEFSLYEQVSRLYPVFINLINNALYWVLQTNLNEKKILLDFKDGEIFIADNGPGVSSDDLEYLFTLFFSRKQRGGRGVGLYLCRQNLLAGGHSIRYETNESRKLLSGANFVLTLKGVS